MKHIKLSLLIFIVTLAACKYDEEGYSFVREYDKGTYVTSQGASKYISGIPDTAIVVRDVYAKVKEEFTYVNNRKDSILIYGHTWSTSPDAEITDTTATFYMIDNDSDGKPDEFIDTLNSGESFTSVLTNLIPETNYYVRSYIITGKFKNGKAVYVDTAFNPVETLVQTDSPKDIWEERTPFDGEEGDGAISFTYNNEIYVGLVNNKFGITKEIYKYSPNTDTWIQATAYPGTLVSNAVAFVIMHVRVNVGVYKDFAYIGTGFKTDGNDTTVSKEFWRWNLTDDNWVQMKDLSAFPGFGREGAIAFTLDNKGYVGLGTGPGKTILKDLYQLDPTATDANHPQGEWKPMKNFRPGPRTEAACFKINHTAFVFGGRDEINKLHNDLWMFRQTIDGKGAWVQKASLPASPREGACGFAIEEFGYIGTGRDVDSLRSDFWRYNPFIDNWQQKAIYGGGPRVNAVGEGIKYGDNDFRGYMGLGRGVNATDYFKDFWQYRP